MVIMLLI